MLSIFETVAAIAVLLVVVLALHTAIRPQWALVVIADQRGVRCLRGIPKLHEASLVEFLEKEVPAQGRITIRGARQKNGLMRLHITGDADQLKQQRIRNFVMSLL